MKHYLYVIAAVLTGVSAVAPTMQAQQPAPRVYINPGHGGHDSNDRPSPFYNHGVNDTTWFYESDASITKSLALRDVLEAKGYEVAMSRIHNTTADDLDLFEIVSLAANSGADIFFAVHSNATGIARKVNYTLSLYRGYTREAPVVAGSDSLARCVAQQLAGNGITPWTHKPQGAGDWTFYSNWGPKTGLGVLRYNKVPGMLCEGSFHDYIPERARLLNPDYCFLEGWNQSVAIDRYFGRTPAVGGVIAGVVRQAGVPHASGVVLTGRDTTILEDAPLCGAVVELLDAAGAVIAMATTDNLYNGVFVFKNLPAGAYAVQLAGDVQSRQPVTVAANSSAYCEFNR